LLGRKGGLVRDSIAVFESVRPVSTGWPACIGLRTSIGEIMGDAVDDPNLLLLDKSVPLSNQRSLGYSKVWV